jgi:hypothetical protein
VSYNTDLPAHTSVDLCLNSNSREHFRTTVDLLVFPFGGVNFDTQISNWVVDIAPRGGLSSCVISSGLHSSSFEIDLTHPCALSLDRPPLNNVGIPSLLCTSPHFSSALHFLPLSLRQRFCSA